jgi:broad specificity polyphosphatase/5'/3'-nucleotidase SurE
MSLRTKVGVGELGPRRFAVHGTPVDCVLVALNGLIPE